MFRCLENCGETSVSSIPLRIRAVCRGSQCSDITAYDWILYEENQSAIHENSMIPRKRINLTMVAITLLNSNVIVIKKNSLVQGRNYSLIVTVQTRDGFLGLSEYNITTSLPPKEGQCFVEPTSGISLETNFTLSCKGWKSNNEPLSFLFQYQLNYNGLHGIIYHGLTDSYISQLPSGFLSNNYTLNITVTVTDKEGASAPVVNSSIQVSKM